MFLTKKWGILIKKESKSRDFTGLEIPRDYRLLWEEANMQIPKYILEINENKSPVLVSEQFVELESGKITEAIMVAELMGIKMLDFIIVASGGKAYYSFKEAELL